MINAVPQEQFLLLYAHNIEEEHFVIVCALYLFYYFFYVSGTLSLFLSSHVYAFRYISCRVVKSTRRFLHKIPIKRIAFLHL